MMGTKAILMAVRDQLETAITDVRNAVPAHTIYAEQYENAEAFWRDVEEQSKGWDVGYRMKRDGLEWRMAYERPKFENIEYAYFWPAMRPLRRLLERVSSYIENSPV
jgi:hypothetical protein